MNRLPHQSSRFLDRETKKMSKETITTNHKQTNVGKQLQIIHF